MAGAAAIGPPIITVVVLGAALAYLAMRIFSSPSLISSQGMEIHR